jgi:hypothetical protein
MSPLCSLTGVPGEQTAQACENAWLRHLSVCRLFWSMIRPVMIRRWIRVPPLTVALFLVLGSSTASDKRPHFLLRAVDASSSSQATAGPNSFSNCLLVLPDGRFYLSLRRQEIMGDTVTLKSLEGSLNEAALRILHGLLNQQTIRNAPTYELPNTPYAIWCRRISSLSGPN